MSVQDFEAALFTVKNKVEGNFKDIVLHLEAAYQHLHISHVEDLVKDAVVNELHAATIKLDNIAANWVLPAITEVEAVAASAEKAVRKATSRKPTVNE